MKSFINNILKYKYSFQIVDIKYRNIFHFQDKVLKELRIKDLNQLRDMFEGEQFYKNKMNIYLPIISLEIFLQTKLFDWENSKIIDFPEYIILSNQRVDLNLTPFGKTSEFDVNSNYPTIFFVLNNTKEVWLCGFGSTEIIKKFQGKKRRIGIGSKSRDVVEFEGFNHLKKFNSLEELLILIKENNE